MPNSFAVCGARSGPPADRRRFMSALHCFEDDGIPASMMMARFPWHPGRQLQVPASGRLRRRGARAGIDVHSLGLARNGIR